MPAKPKAPKTADSKDKKEKPKNGLAAYSGRPLLTEKQHAARVWWSDPQNRTFAFNRISELLISGKGIREIRRILASEKLPVGQLKVERITKRIKDEWLRDDAENRKTIRATHARRLLSEIDEARKDRAWGNVFTGENVYGKVTGTIVPENIHVHVDRVDLVQQVLGGLDDARLKELYDRQLIREKMLQSAGLSLPVVREGTLIDIDPKEVQHEVEAALVEREAVDAE